MPWQVKVSVSVSGYGVSRPLAAVASSQGENRVIVLCPGGSGLCGLEQLPLEEVAEPLLVLIA